MKSEIIGVIGTLLGTILGWVLGKLDVGRLRISFFNTEEEFTSIENTAPIHSEPPTYRRSYSLRTTLQLYNSSNINQVIREVQIVFANGRRDLLKVDAKDNDTRKRAALSYHYDNLSIANIPPHTGVDIKIHIDASDVDQIYETKKILLQYKNQRLKTKRVHIKTMDYSIRKPIIKEVENNA